MSDTAGVCWYRHGATRVLASTAISMLGIVPADLILYGSGHPVRWTFLVPGAVLAAAVAALASLPLRAGIGATAEHIIIRTLGGSTRMVPWTQVTGFEGGKDKDTGKDTGEVIVLTSGGERLHTAGYRLLEGPPAEFWPLVHALEQERLARTPGAESTLPPPPPPEPEKFDPLLFTASLGVIALIALGSIQLYIGVTGIGPALRAAHGGGTVGYYVPQRETSGKGGPHWHGEFRLPGGTVTRRDTFLEDVSSTALQTGRPVAARDTGYSDGVYPRDDPGAWHSPASLLVGGSAPCAAALVVIVLARIRWRQRHDRDGDGNTAPSPQTTWNPNLLTQQGRPRAHSRFRMPNRRSAWV